MSRYHAWIIGTVTALHALGVFALAQDYPIPATVRPPGPPTLYRLSLEDAEQLALANNTGLTVIVEPLPPPVPVNDAEEAVELALRCNPQVQEALANVDKARAALKVANADFLPDVNIFGSYFNQTSASYIQPNFGAFGVSASYTFIDWGKRRRVKDRARTQIAQASYNVRATVEKIRLETVQTYVGYQQAQQALSLADDMVQARKDVESRLKDPAAVETEGCDR